MQSRIIPDSTMARRLIRCLPVCLLIAEGAASLGSDTLAGSIAYDNYEKMPSGGTNPAPTSDSTSAPPASAPLKSEASQSNGPDSSFHPARNGSIGDRRLQAPCDDNNQQVIDVFAEFDVGITGCADIAFLCEEEDWLSWSCCSTCEDDVCADYELALGLLLAEESVFTELGVASCADVAAMGLCGDEDLGKICCATCSAVPEVCADNDATAVALASSEGMSVGGCADVPFACVDSIVQVVCCATCSAYDPDTAGCVVREDFLVAAIEVFAPDMAQHVTGCADVHDYCGHDEIGEIARAWCCACEEVKERWTLLEGGKNTQCGKWAESAHRYWHVPSKMACQKKAIENEHTHFSYTKSAAKCMTSDGCDDIRRKDGWKVFVAPAGEGDEPELWEPIKTNKRCKRSKGTREYLGVSSAMECQGKAIHNGHAFFSFKHINNKCFTTPDCAVKRVKYSWTIYKAPAGWN